MNSAFNASLFKFKSTEANAVGGITALVMSFVGNKFLVMRNWGEKKNKKSEENACNSDDCACCSCPDCQSQNATQDASSALDEAAADKE